jgi:hypothetical protein
MNGTSQLLFVGLPVRLDRHHLCGVRVQPPVRPISYRVKRILYFLFRISSAVHPYGFGVPHTVLPTRLSGRIKGINLPLASDIMVRVAGKAKEKVKRQNWF